MREFIADLEANGLNEWKNGNPPADKIWCGVFTDNSNGDTFSFSPDNLVGIEPQEAIEKFLDTQVDKLVGHNFIAYDMELLKRLSGYEFKGEVEDTYILSQISCPDRVGGHGLDNFGKLLGIPKPVNEDWSKFTKHMLHRCREDVKINREALKKIREEMVNDVRDPKQDWALSVKIEHAFAQCIVDQTRKGFLVDRVLMEGNLGVLSRYLSNIDRVTLPKLPLRTIPVGTKKSGLNEYTFVKPFLKNGLESKAHLDWMVESFEGKDPRAHGAYTRVTQSPIDLGSASQFKTYLLSQGWVPDEWNVSKKTGKTTSPKLSANDAFLGVEGKLGKIVSKRLKYSHRQSNIKGLMKLIRPDGRISAGIAGLCPTARLKHRGVVNIPSVDALFGKKMRAMFTAPEGYSIVGCDASSCQLRMLCHYMGDEEYTKVVLYGKESEGTDVHSVNMRIAGLKTRGEAKTLIYAILFGAGDRNLAAQLKCSVKQARAMRKNFISKLPKLAALLNGLKTKWKKYGYIRGIDGRKIFVRSEHMLLVYLLQSAEAVMMKVATLFAVKYCKGYDASMVAHIHDEYQFEVFDKDVEKVSELLEKSIVKAGEYLKLGLPMGGVAKSGKTWKDTH